MLHFAVMGCPIDHSLSPLIHQRFAQQLGINLTYEPLFVEDQFEQAVHQFFATGGAGLNITAPYKQRAFAMCEDASMASIQAKAANTLWLKNGKLYADNTDGIGFLTDIQRYINLNAKKILMLGAGGAARSIMTAVLSTQLYSLTIANRTLLAANELMQEFEGPIHCVTFSDLNSQYDIIIHATSAHQQGQLIPIPNQIFKHASFCYDLAYQRHGFTPFIAQAMEQGCEGKDGMGMLIEQAAEAFYRWHNVKPNTESIIAKFKSE